MAASATRVDRPVAIRPRLAMVLAAFAGVSITLTTLVGIAAAHEQRAGFMTGQSWLDGWFQGDSGWYYGIAADGYHYTPGQQSSIAFFPTYPMLVRGLGVLIGNYQVAGSIVAVLSGAGAVLLFAVFVRRRLPYHAAVLAIAVLMLYPYSFFLYGAVYSDSVFLLAALGAFLLVERRMYWLAGLVGALATAGRPVGVAVAIGLVVRVLELRAEERRATPLTGSTPQPASPAPEASAEAAVEAPAPTPPAATSTTTAHPGAITWPSRPGWRDLLRAVPTVRWREAGVLLSGLGLLAWCTYLGIRFGDPLAFATVQGAPGWNQGGGPRTWFKINFVGLVLLGPYDVALKLAAQALMCLLAVLLLRPVWRLFGWGYLVYAVVVLAIPLIGTKDFMGTGRYVMAAFPVLAAAGHVLATRCPRWLRIGILATSGIGLVVATYFYSQGVALT